MLSAATTRPSNIAGRPEALQIDRLARTPGFGPGLFLCLEAAGWLDRAGLCCGTVREPACQKRAKWTARSCAVPRRVALRAIIMRDLTAGKFLIHMGSDGAHRKIRTFDLSLTKGVKSVIECPRCYPNARAGLDFLNWPVTRVSGRYSDLYLLPVGIEWGEISAPFPICSQNPH